MHLFLTGTIQIGKSTVVNKVIQLLDVSSGGFRTYFGRDRANPNRCLYICNASQPPSFEEEHVIVRFRQLSPPEIYTETFEVLGTEYIREAERNARLIVMDECGSLESGAGAFTREILKALDGPVPILGVVKESARGWTDSIRSHPNVRLITVDESNRDSLPAQLAETINGLL